jgi:hypothetical protein
VPDRVAPAQPDPMMIMDFLGEAMAAGV